MGSRGPIRGPQSIRSERERRKRARLGIQDEPQQLEQLAMPEWLPKNLEGEWDRTVQDLRCAGVPLAAIDSQAVGHFVLVGAEAVKAAASGDARTAARLGRDALTWASQIGATPASRVRMNIKPPKPAADNEWADFDRLGSEGEPKCLKRT
jgi:hypothetical protein